MLGLCQSIGDVNTVQSKGKLVCVPAPHLPKPTYGFGKCGAGTQTKESVLI